MEVDIQDENFSLTIGDTAISAVIDNVLLSSDIGELQISADITQEGFAIDLSSDVVEFIELIDTPSSYTGNSEKLVRVKDSEDSLEFVEYIKSVTVQSPITGGGSSGHILIGLDQSEIDHKNIQNIGVNTHDEIDSHISSTNNPHDVIASQVDILDSGSYYTVDNVEQALQEIGSGETLDPRYLRRDTSTAQILLDDSLILKPQENSIITFQIQGKSGDSLFIADTINRNIEMIDTGWRPGFKGDVTIGYGTAIGSSSIRTNLAIIRNASTDTSQGSALQAFVLNLTTDQAGADLYGIQGQVVLTKDCDNAYGLQFLSSVFGGNTNKNYGLSAGAFGGITSYGAYISNQPFLTTTGYGLYIRSVSPANATNYWGAWIEERVYIVNTITGNVPLIIKSASGQLASSTEWQDSSGTVLSAIEDRGTHICDLGTDSSNLFVGPSAGNTTTTGTNNTAIGDCAGCSLTTGGNNFFIGAGAGNKVTTGIDNVFVGINAGYGDAGGNTGNFNVAIGKESGLDLTSGQWNVLIGWRAGYNVTSGYSNTILGMGTGFTLTDGYQNTMIGTNAGRLLTSGDDNIFIGFKAGYNQTTNDDLLIIDNRDQGSAAAEITNAIIYGVMASSPSSQTLRLNAAVTILPDGAAIIPLTIKGASSQTANLTEWVDSSAEKGVVISPDAKEIRWYDSGASNYVGFKAPDLTVNQTYNLMPNDGGLNDVIRTDGSGNLSFVTLGAGVRGASGGLVDGAVLRWETADTSWLQSTSIIITDTKEVQIGDGGITDYTEFDELGYQRMYERARVRKGAWLPAQALKVPAVNQATYVDWGCSGAWEFANVLTQEVRGNLSIPTDVDRSEDMNICLGWSSSAINLDADIEIDYLITKDDEDTQGSCTTLQSYETSSTVQDGLVITKFTIPNEEVDTEDLCIHLAVRRDGGDAGDTINTTIQLHGIVLEYVSNKLGKIYSTS